jgi:ketosteroid isomerase-like protein
VSSDPISVATEGFEAWRSGDFATLQRIFDPAVEWRWFEPGEWDCRNREDVMRTLRQRYDQGFAKGGLEFKKVGEDAVIVVSHPSDTGGTEWPQETATLIRFREGRVVSMQDYRTEAEAVDAVT